MEFVTTFIPNRCQETIFNFITDESKGNLMVSAKAGTGKTMTIVEAVKLIPEHKNAIILAFSKHIADELREKVPRNIEIRTTHSLGFEAIREFNGERRTFSGNQSKMYKIIRKVIDDRNHKFMMEKNEYEIVSKMMFNEIKTKLVRTIDHFRNTLLEVNEENLELITMKFDLPIPMTAEAELEIINKALEEDRADTINIDYTDMIYLSTMMIMPFRKFDYVFIDESQDINESQLRMLLMIKSKTGRIIAVGDEKQAIYGFRSADSDAMNKIRLATKAEELPLNICYRCPKTHIMLANQLVPDMEPAPDAINGEIFVISGETLYQHIQPGDLAICRNNAPLVRPALELLKDGTKVNIRGQNLKKSLIDLIKETGTDDIPTMRRMLIEYRETEVEKLKKKGKNPLSIMDKVGVILEFARESENVREVINYIDILLNDTDAEITFSTVHGAKGLESDNIFFINSFLIPSSYATQEWELQSEDNIMYVALTRAKRKLFFVDIHDRSPTPEMTDYIEDRNITIRRVLASVQSESKPESKDDEILPIENPFDKEHLESLLKNEKLQGGEKRELHMGI